MKSEDLRLTILGCFRYSLGRMTYMPSFTIQMIKENQKIFHRQDWERFINEIKECKYLGMDCDKQTWFELIKLAKQKLKET